LSPGTPSTIFTAPHSEPVPNNRCRHGARLDAADKSWHLTSPAPYDPPLTYGGWSQAKALGQRIAALLHQRDNEQAETASSGTKNDSGSLDFSKLNISKEGGAQGNGPRRPRKKQKIVIHSSPFLRCVQTSTAVAAGISQYQTPTTPQPGVPIPLEEKNGVPGSSSAKAPRDKVQSRPKTFEPLADPNLAIVSKRHTGPERILLRIDAFLGEWLSPDYYADITPPPNSTFMVTGAKADLLRRGDYVQEQPNPNSSKGNFPGGWMGNKATDSNTQSPGKGAMSSLAQVAPFRERSNSYHAGLTLQRTKSREAPASLAVPAAIPRQGSSLIYEPPHPSYSVSAADPIPRGYVAHAQEACVKVDFQWDSMRPPQDWGDGGEYGDEWSTMHKRFRRGLAGMMQWYRLYGVTPPKNPIQGFMFKEPLRLTPSPVSHAKSDPFPNFSGDVGVDEEEELVLILVTHGAGCNAMLGAMTNQPVLMDIGLASLSMAVRRDEPKLSAALNPDERRASVADPGMSETYEVKLSASVDHLRPGVDPSKPPSAQTQTQSPAVTASPSLEYRRRFTGSSTSSSPIEASFSIGEPYRNWNSSLGSMRRTLSNGPSSRSMQRQGSASSSNGLWSATRAPAPDTDGRVSPGADMVLNFATHQPAKPTTYTATTTNATIPAVEGPPETNDLTRMTSKEEREVNDKFTPLVSAQARKQSTNTAKSTNTGATGGLWGAKKVEKSSNGLWGPPKLDDIYEHSHGPKRRWTVTEREESL
jgi:broad specificity phosphatase PhoE